MSDYGYVPTEAVDPRRQRPQASNTDFRANRPSLDMDDASDASPAPRRGGGRALDMVPDEFAAQFRAFDDDDFFRDDVHLDPNWSAQRPRSESASSSSSSASSVHEPIRNSSEARKVTWPSRHSAQPLETFPSRASGDVGAAPGAAGGNGGSIWSRLGRSLSGAWSSVTGAIRNGWNRLTGRRPAAPASPQPAAARPASFDYGDAAMTSLFPQLEAKRQKVDYSRLQAAVPGRAEDLRHADDFGGNEFLAQAAQEQAQAVAAMQRAMGKPAGGAGAGAARLSSQSDLDAQFNAMDDDDAEDLLAPGPAAAPAAGGNAERSRSSLLREGDNWFNNMRDSEGMPGADGEADISQRLSIDVENPGGLEEDLQNIPHDMRDHPWAKILYEPQRRRMHHEGQ